MPVGEVAKESAREVGDLRIKQRAGHLGFSTTEIYIRVAENLRKGFGEVFPAFPPELTGARLGQGPPYMPISGEYGGATGDRTGRKC